MLYSHNAIFKIKYTMLEKLKTYKANPNLKAHNVSMPFTKEQVAELSRCYKDPVYFIENYVKIVNIDNGLVLFKLYDFQKGMVRHILENDKVIMKMSRQVGKTTTTAACVLWYLIFNEFKTCAILANKNSTAREIISRIQLMYEHLPKWMQVGVVEWNKSSFVLGNNSRCLSSATSSSAIRGTSINFLLLDEFGFVPDGQAIEFFESVYPTISSGKNTKIAMVSTPKGLNHFYKFWSDAVSGKSEFKAFEAKWNDVPGRDEEWKRKTISNIGEESWKQEFECEFLGSSGTLISTNKLKGIVVEEPIYANDNFLAYEKPQPNKSYFLTADVSYGVGRDYSTIQVIDKTSKPFVQVAVFRDNKINYIRFAELIVNISKTYNNAPILVESNAIGEAVNIDLLELVEEADVLAYNNFNLICSTHKVKGIKTTKKTKRIGCNNLKFLIENNLLIIKDKQTLFELSNFVSKGDSFEADVGQTDDLVMALVFFSLASQCDNFNDKIGQVTWKEEVYNNNDLPFGFFDDGMTNENFPDVF